MKNTSKLLAMTAAITVLAAPAMAETTIRTKVGENVTYKVTNNPAPGSEIVGYQIEQRQEFARLDQNGNGTVTREEFYDNVMLDDEAEIYALFDSDQSGEITPQEFEMNSRYGNGRLTNPTTNAKRNYSNTNFGSMREKYYTVDTVEYYEVEPASGRMNSRVEAGIDYNGVDQEPNVNQGIDYRGDVRTPGTVEAGIDYRTDTRSRVNYN